MSDDNAAKKLEKYKENVRENVAVLLEKTFPEKILELNELLESEKLSIKRLETIHVRVTLKTCRLGKLEGEGYRGHSRLNCYHFHVFSSGKLTKFIGGSKGALGMPSPGPISFIFMQFSVKILSNSNNRFLVQT